MITTNVFLTASHCTVFYEQDLAPEGYVAYVSLDTLIPFGSLTSSKTNLLSVAHVVSNPNYNQRQSDSGDIAVLILDRNVRGVTPATLPACGLLDQLAAQNGLQNAVFTNAGYGLQNRVVGGGGVPFYQDLNPVPRMFSFSSFNSLNGGYLRLSQNPSTETAAPVSATPEVQTSWTSTGGRRSFRSRSRAIRSVAQQTWSIASTRCRPRASWRP